MNTQILNKCTSHRRRMAAIPATLLILVQSAWAEPVPEDFEMLVYNDTRQGQRLASGEYADALAINAKQDFDSFDGFNNRCVLLTMTKSFEEASKACNRAVEVNASKSRADRAWAYAARRRVQKAMALTNRGVLRAVTGDVAGARQDFQEVVALNADSRAARANLIRLDAEYSEMAGAVTVN